MIRGCFQTLTPFSFALSKFPLGYICFQWPDNPLHVKPIQIKCVKMVAWVPLIRIIIMCCLINYICLAERTNGLLYRFFFTWLYITAARPIRCFCRLPPIFFFFVELWLPFGITATASMVLMLPSVWLRRWWYGWLMFLTAIGKKNKLTDYIPDLPLPVFGLTSTYSSLLICLAWMLRRNRVGTGRNGVMFFCYPRYVPDHRKDTCRSLAVALMAVACRCWAWYGWHQYLQPLPLLFCIWHDQRTSFWFSSGAIILFETSGTSSFMAVTVVRQLLACGCFCCRATFLVSLLSILLGFMDAMKFTR